MSRPQKDGVDYFPFDVVLDEKFDLIEAEFGLTGFAVVVKLYQRVYQRGYYCEWTNEVALLFGHSVGLGGNAVSEIVNAAVKRGIFDKDMFDKCHILTSHGIQERYFEAVSRRKCVKAKKEYLLVDVTRILPNASISWVNDSNNPENASNNSQSKGKESRVNKSKVKKNSRSAPAAAASDRRLCISLILNDNSEYPVYQDQADKWAALYPAVDVGQELRKMAGWCEANPKRRKTKRGVLNFINSWLSREQDRGGNQNYGDRADQHAGNSSQETPKTPAGNSLGTVV